MKLNTASRVPKHVQAASLLKQRIRKGVYLPDSKLPPVRTLGAELGVSINVIMRAAKLLEKEGLVESQHGVGVRVVSGSRRRRIPLTFGMVHPYTPDEAFAGTIHCCAERALDLAENLCIVRSSYNDPERERRVVEDLIAVGVEGLIVWPCEGDSNGRFLTETARTVPLVLIDRELESAAVPSVVLDFAGAGRDIVQHLATRGRQDVLILEDPIEISSFREFFAAMRETVARISGEDRFEFVQLATTRFPYEYSADPLGAADRYVRRLDAILDARAYDAMFSMHDEFIDTVFAASELGRAHPSIELYCMSNLLPRPRSVDYHRRITREWYADFGKLIRRAAELLHDKLYLRSCQTRPDRVKFSTERPEQSAGAPSVLP